MGGPQFEERDESCWLVCSRCHGDHADEPSSWAMIWASELFEDTNSCRRHESPVNFPSPSTYRCKSGCVSTETSWAWASLPWSTRSWSWRPSRPSEPRSSRCTAAVCRSDGTADVPEVSRCCCRCRRMRRRRKRERARERERERERESSSRLTERWADLSATPLFAPPPHTSSCLPWYPSFLILLHFY